jgi:hypothetical protein
MTANYYCHFRELVAYIQLKLCQLTTKQWSAPNPTYWNNQAVYTQ